MAVGVREKISVVAIRGEATQEQQQQQNATLKDPALDNGGHVTTQNQREERGGKKLLAAFSMASFLNDFGSDVIYLLWRAESAELFLDQFQDKDYSNKKTSQT